MHNPDHAMKLALVEHIIMTDSEEERLVDLLTLSSLHPILNDDESDQLFYGEKRREEEEGS